MVVDDHLTMEVNANDTETNEYKCVSCNHTWNDKYCVVEHNIKNIEMENSKLKMELKTHTKQCDADGSYRKLHRTFHMFC